MVRKGPEITETPVTASSAQSRFTERVVTWAISRKTQSLKLSPLERVTPAQPAILDVDRLGLRVFLGPVLCDEASLTVVAVDLESPLTAGRSRKPQPGLRIVGR
jgi:hypothetical protein